MGPISVARSLNPRQRRTREEVHALIYIHASAVLSFTVALLRAPYVASKIILN